MYVGEIIVPGGKYPSAEGGFRPAFDSGGAQRDAIRNIRGEVGYLHTKPMTAAELNEPWGIAAAVYISLIL
jgi:hypothetical protein